MSQCRPEALPLLSKQLDALETQYMGKTTVLQL